MKVKTALVKIRKALLAISAVSVAAEFMIGSTRAQETATSPVAAPTSSVAPTPATATMPAASASTSEAEMMKQMMEMAKLNDNHKLLGTLAGTWKYAVQMWEAPNTPPQKSAGTAVRKAIMGGRYYMADFKGAMKMPGADGKMKDMTFLGHSIEGYDNTKQKFVASWVDNFGTGVMMLEGTYDPATKSFTYTSEMEMMPGMKAKVREVLKVTDKDHHTLEWYEDRGQGEMKTMEINYTRSK